MERLCCRSSKILLQLSPGFSLPYVLFLNFIFEFKSQEIHMPHHFNLFSGINLLVFSSPFVAKTVMLLRRGIRKSTSKVCFHRYFRNCPQKLFYTLLCLRSDATALNSEHCAVISSILFGTWCI